MNRGSKPGVQYQRYVKTKKCLHSLTKRDMYQGANLCCYSKSVLGQGFVASNMIDIEYVNNFEYESLYSL